MNRFPCVAAGFIFALIAIAQAYRWWTEIVITANGVEVPLWISLVATVVLALLSYWFFSCAFRRKLS